MTLPSSTNQVGSIAREASPPLGDRDRVRIPSRVVPRESGMRDERGGMKRARPLALTGRTGTAAQGPRMGPLAPDRRRGGSSAARTAYVVLGLVGPGDSRRRGGGGVSTQVQHFRGGARARFSYAWYSQGRDQRITTPPVVTARPSRSRLSP